MEEYRTTFVSRSYRVGVKDLSKTREQRVADLFICAGLVSSRREFREQSKNFRLIRIDPYTFLLGKLKKGHLFSARFVDLV